ncbi:MAG: YdcF family protein [Acidimicrobiales bacterium]
MKVAKASRWTAVSACGAVAASELLHWRASRWDLPAPARRGRCALIVLGYPTKRSGELRAVQRWRVEMAKRALDRLGAELVVFSGSASRGRPAEGDAMAAYAEVLGVPAHLIATESRASTTWENVEFSMPLLENFDRLAFVSDPLHAARARRYLRAQRPELAGRLVSAGEYRFLERWWLKVPAAGYELLELYRTRRSLRRSPVTSVAP